ncbi:hypothetical protein HII31_02111 [Pseudocercospora fuligena]|uniref:Metallo-beta-lactamase domain-containing protein n=1 Tax=Pseudocercospora fuligena TaxID=685502 RepID=A0A8H6RQT6_9PEZI|nr:hypothetical protein HII31_02111 [Pseudocercospora fuligena]
MATTDRRRVCSTCGTQYDTLLDDSTMSCRMCNEPRQFLPPIGQAWTSLADMQGHYKNQIKQDELDGRIWSIFTQPQFAIGQRAVFLETDEGNILWDCVSFLDQDTIDFIRSRGGLRAIAISHPHFYTTHLAWAKEFDCPVYLTGTEKAYLNRIDEGEQRIFVDQEVHEILPGVNMIRLGGHFPGSSVLHYDNTVVCSLLCQQVEETSTNAYSSLLGSAILTCSQSGLNLSNHTKEHQVFFFHYAQPNFIPLGPTGMHSMWKRLSKWDFHTLHSLFYGAHVRHPHVKRFVLESMQLQARYEEHEDHAIIAESCDAALTAESQL